MRKSYEFFKDEPLGLILPTKSKNFWGNSEEILGFSEILPDFSSIDHLKIHGFFQKSCLPAAPTNWGQIFKFFHKNWLLQNFRIEKKNSFRYFLTQSKSRCKNNFFSVDLVFKEELNLMLVDASQGGVGLSL